MRIKRIGRSIVGAVALAFLVAAGVAERCGADAPAPTPSTSVPAPAPTVEHDPAPTSPAPMIGSTPTDPEPLPLATQLPDMPWTDGESFRCGVDSLTQVRWIGGVVQWRERALTAAEVQRCAPKPGAPQVGGAR